MSEQLRVEGIGAVEVSFSERGQGQPIVVLHGGAGPFSVVPWAELVARTRPARVITPTHPGFMGTPRPETLDDAGKLARVYAALLQKLGIARATIVGNSVGGWIAAELALHAPSLVSRLVLVDAGGIEVLGHPIPDVFAMSSAELSKLSFHDPAKFAPDFSKMTPEQKAMGAANRAALQAYRGDKADPTLLMRLGKIAAPTLVVWGESDRVMDVDYGHAYAQAIPNARFQLLAGCGHLPQLETPQLLADTIWPFIAE